MKMRSKKKKCKKKSVGSCIGKARCGGRTRNLEMVNPYKSLTLYLERG
jgi:hypothetical protein